MHRNVKIESLIIMLISAVFIVSCGKKETQEEYEHPDRFVGIQTDDTNNTTFIDIEENSNQINEDDNQQENDNNTINYTDITNDTVDNSSPDSEVQINPNGVNTKEIRDNLDSLTDYSWAGEYEPIVRNAYEVYTVDSTEVDTKLEDEGAGEWVEDVSGFRSKTSFRNVANVVNQMCINQGYDSIEVLEMPDETDTSTDKIAYVLRHGYDYWLVLYFFEDDEAMCFHDTSGYYGSIYNEPEEEVEWDD